VRRILDRFIYQTPYAALWLATGLALLLSLFFLSANVWLPTELPQFFTSQAQLLGQVLLMTLMPSYVLGMAIVAQRRSLRSARKLQASGLIEDHPDNWLRPLPTVRICIGVVLGLLYAITVNLPTEWVLRLTDIDFQEGSIVAGQSLVWISCGLGLAFRFNSATLFNEQGRTVAVDIYDSSKLESFARNGVDDVLLITGALGLTAIQALDAQFRLGNFLAAVLVGLPAAAYLLVRPMWAVHLRLLQQKREFLADINAQITQLREAVAPIPELELVLQHRDRLQRTYTWPIDLAIVYRLLFYVVIPPLAWLGAALMETAVQEYLK
jgi:amino acid transporter